MVTTRASTHTARPAQVVIEGKKPRRTKEEMKIFNDQQAKEKAKKEKEVLQKAELRRKAKVELAKLEIQEDDEREMEEETHPRRRKVKDNDSSDGDEQPPPKRQKANTASSTVVHMSKLKPTPKNSALDKHRERTSENVPTSDIEMLCTDEEEPNPYQNSKESSGIRNRPDLAADSEAEHTGEHETQLGKGMQKMTTKAKKETDSVAECEAEHIEEHEMPPGKRAKQMSVKANEDSVAKSEGEWTKECEMPEKRARKKTAKAKQLEDESDIGVVSDDDKLKTPVPKPRKKGSNKALAIDDDDGMNTPIARKCTTTTRVNRTTNLQEKAGDEPQVRIATLKKGNNRHSRTEDEDYADVSDGEKKPPKMREKVDEDMERIKSDILAARDSHNKHIVPESPFRTKAVPKNSLTAQSTSISSKTRKPVMDDPSDDIEEQPFEEDQEVERQAALSSPIKNGKRLTSKNLTKVVGRSVVNNSRKDQKKTAPSLRVVKLSEKLDVKKEAEELKIGSGVDDDDDDDDNDDNSEASDSKPRNKTKRARANNETLPKPIRQQMHLWKSTVLGILRAHIACLNDAWQVSDKTQIRLLQAIWNHFSLKAYTFGGSDSVLPNLKQRFAEWRNGFGQAALIALKDLLATKRSSDRNVIVRKLLHSDEFIYGKVSRNENGQVKYSSPFMGELVLQTFAYHFSMISPETSKVTEIEQPKRPLAALALAAAAVQRALTLWDDGFLVLHNKTCMFRKGRTKEQKDENKFSATKWSEVTDWCLHQLRGISDSKIDHIVARAKDFAIPSTRHQNQTPVDCDERQDLVLQWSD